MLTLTCHQDVQKLTADSTLLLTKYIQTIHDSECNMLTYHLKVKMTASGHYSDRHKHLQIIMKK